MRIFLSSSDSINQTPLYEQIVLQAKNEGLAGATVLKGILGFGASSVIHSYKFWEVTDKVPVVIEIIDDTPKIEAFYKIIRPTLEGMKYGCLVSFVKTEVLLYKTGEKRLL